MENQAQNKKPQGWLLVYIVWTAISIVAALIMMIYGIFSLPELPTRIYLIFVLSNVAICAWYILYAWFLRNLALVRQGAVKPIKFMIIGTPVINAIMPLAQGIALKFMVNDISLKGFLHGSYTQNTIISLSGAFLIAFIWLVYFYKSKQVRELWQEG